MTTPVQMRQIDRQPKISVVTATYNQAAYLEETVNSILGQNYPNLEYVVIDDGSTDDTQRILQKYAHRLTRCISRPNKGQYETIMEAFEHTTGDIMAWLNSDDRYLPWCFSVVADIFSAYPEVEWLTTIYPIAINCAGQATDLKELEGFNRDYFYKGGNLPNGNGFSRTHIQQESTFWRRSLWERAGARLDTRYNLAADFELWARFFRYAELYGVAVPLGSFRVQPLQKTSLYPQEYEHQCRKILQEYGGCPPGKFELWYRKHVIWRMPSRLQTYYRAKVFYHEKHDTETWALHTSARL
jgi:glycosyltransferase involved in cell wall biosynthesis